MNQLSAESFRGLIRASRAWPGKLAATASQHVQTIPTRCRKSQGGADGGDRPVRLRRGTRLRRAAWAVATCMFAFLLASPLSAQQQPKKKLPIIGKLSNGFQRLAYSGTIQSVNLKQKVLNVNSDQGHDTEIFPLRKDIHIQGVSGEKMKLKALTPGTSVLIYYQVRGGTRAIKEIIVLCSGKSGPKHPPAS